MVAKCIQELSSCYFGRLFVESRSIWRFVPLVFIYRFPMKMSSTMLLPANVMWYRDDVGEES